MKFKYFLIGILLFFVGLYFCVFQEINTDDETWFLQVVRRVVSGEVLYRDVYLGVTPLSVYITSFFSKLFRVELLLARALLSAYFAMGVLLSIAILKELKVPFSILLILSFVVSAHLQSTWGFSAYNNLAKVLFLSCFYFTLKWSNCHFRLHLILAGAFAGLCFSAKQNIGGIAFLCILTIFLLMRPKKFAQNLVILSLSFSLVVGVCLLPTILHGGWEKFIDYAVLNKTRYVAAEHCNYFLIPNSWDNHTIFIFAVPFLLLSLSFFSISQLRKQPALIVFTLGAILNLYPRPDHSQKMLFISCALIASVYLFHQVSFRPFIRKVTKVGLSGWFLTALTISVITPYMQLRNGKKSISNIRYFNHIAMDSECLKHWELMQQQWKTLKLGSGCFFLSTHSGFYSLLFHRVNRTPFDYPIHPALGCSGEATIMQKLQDHQIEHLLIDHPSWSNWQSMIRDRHPFILESFIETQMQESKKIEEGSLKNVFQIFNL